MRPISWIVLVLAAAGCGDGTAPLADLSELRSSLALVDTVFASPLVQSLGFFELVPPLPAPSAGAPLVPDSLLGKTLAWSCAAQLRVQHPGRHAAARRFRRGLACRAAPCGGDGRGHLQ